MISHEFSPSDICMCECMCVDTQVKKGAATRGSNVAFMCSEAASDTHAVFEALGCWQVR